VLSKLAYLTLCRFIQLLVLLARGDAAKDLEILVLRHQLTALGRQIPRPRLESADRALLAAVSRVLPRSRWSCFLVKPETLLRWHRRLVAGAWTYPYRQTGRPPLDHEVQQLIICLARDTPRWATSASKAGCSGLVSASLRPRSARRCVGMGWTRHRGGPPARGGRSVPASGRDPRVRLLPSRPSGWTHRAWVGAHRQRRSDAPEARPELGHDRIPEGGGHQQPVA
jgi:hypothetical protein